MSRLADSLFQSLTNMELKLGKTYDFTMKPTIMRSWKLVRKTKKCFVVTKNRKGAKKTNEDGYHSLIPMKLVMGAKEL